MVRSMRHALMIKSHCCSGKRRDRCCPHKDGRGARGEVYRNVLRGRPLHDGERWAKQADPDLAR